MIEKIDIETFLKLSNEIPVIDVRSPSEYKQGHIPGAINIPLFTDEERAEVGTTYKRKSKQDAVILGLKIVGPKMQSFAKTALKTANKNRVLMHCWRGGMRSESMAWLFSTIGIETKLLKNGYKSYRAFIKKELSKPYKLIILSGYTGSGKTEIL